MTTFLRSSRLRRSVSATVALSLLATSFLISQAVSIASASAATTWTRLGIPVSSVATSSSPGAPNSAAVVPVSQNQLAWVSLKTLNSVQPVNAATGEAVGSPIPLPTGDSPIAMAYWRPNIGSTSATSTDPFIAVLSNNTTTGTDYVTFIDALTKTETSTISLGGSLGTAIAASESSDVVAVTDSNATNSASRVKIISMVTRSVVQTFATIATSGNRLTGLAFDSLGSSVAIVSPTLHKVYNLQPIAVGATTFTQATGSTYTGASTFTPQFITSDQTNLSSSRFFVTSGLSSGTAALYSVDDFYLGGGTPSVTTVTTFSSPPGALQVSASSHYCFVALPTRTSNNVAVVDLTAAPVVLRYLTTTASPSQLAVS